MKYLHAFLIVTFMGFASSSPLMANTTNSSWISSVFSSNYGKLATVAAVATTGLYAYFKASYTWHTKTSDGCNAGGYRTCTYHFDSIAFRPETAFAAIQKKYNKILTNLDEEEWGDKVSISKGTPTAPWPNPYWPLSYVTRRYKLNGNKQHPA